MADTPTYVALAVAAVSGLFALGATLYEVRAGREKQIADGVDARKLPFRERQFETLMEALRTTSRLATCRQVETWLKAREHFWYLYWGEMAVVENVEVEHRMVAFGKALEKLGDNPNLPASVLESQSAVLAYRIRSLILSSWNIDMPELSERLIDHPKAAD